MRRKIIFVAALFCGTFLFFGCGGSDKHTTPVSQEESVVTDKKNEESDPNENIEATEEIEDKSEGEEFDLAEEQPDDDSIEESDAESDGEVITGSAGFVPDTPATGGINYVYRIDSAYYDDGYEADYNHMDWFISYTSQYSEICAPIWDECEWGDAVGTELDELPADFSQGELELTAYNCEGELFSSRTLRFNINGDSATVYNVDEGITYNCSLVESFTYTN